MNSPYISLPTLFLLAFLVFSNYISTMLVTIKRVFHSAWSPIPGPKLARFTGLWIKYKVLRDSGRVWETVHRLHKKYGAIVRVSPSSVSVCHPDALRTIYYGPRGLPGGALLSTLRQYNSDNLVSTLDPDLHFARRKQVSSLYSAPVVSSAVFQSALKTHLSQFAAAIEEEASSSPSRVANGLGWITWLTADVMIQLVYGSNHTINLLSKKESRDIMAELMPKTNAADVTAYEALATLYPKIISRLIDIFPPKSTMADFGLNQVESALNKGSICKATEPTEPIGPVSTHLGRLVELYKNNGTSREIPDKRYIASDCLDHFLAGTRTTNDLLGAMLWHLSLPENKARQERLRLELRNEDIGPESHPDVVKLQKLSYLNCILKETMRTNPPIPLHLPRIVKEGETLTVLGFKINPGTTVASQSFTLHQDSNIYPDPEVWRPERWEVPSTSDQHRQMQRSFWPFGSGARMCTGMNVAWAISRLVTAKIFSTYSTSLDAIWFDQNGTIVPPEKRDGLYPSLPNMPLRFEKIDSS